MLLFYFQKKTTTERKTDNCHCKWRPSSPQQCIYMYKGRTVYKNHCKFVQTNRQLHWLFGRSERWRLCNNRLYCYQSLLFSQRCSRYWHLLRDTCRCCWHWVSQTKSSDQSRGQRSQLFQVARQFEWWLFTRYWFSRFYPECSRRQRNRKWIFARKFARRQSSIIWTRE